MFEAPCCVPFWSSNNYKKDISNDIENTPPPDANTVKWLEDNFDPLSIPVDDEVWNEEDEINDQLENSFEKIIHEPVDGPEEVSNPKENGNDPENYCEEEPEDCCKEPVDTINWPEEEHSKEPDEHIIDSHE